jgi:hypothetical protein
MDMLLKIWNLFLVGGSGPTGFKGGQREIDSAFNINPPNAENFIPASS